MYEKREGVGHYRPFSLASVLLTVDSGKNSAKRIKVNCLRARLLSKQTYLGLRLRSSPLMEPSPDPSTRSSAHSPSGDTSCGSQEIGRIFGGLFLFSYEEAAPQTPMSVCPSSRKYLSYFEACARSP